MAAAQDPVAPQPQPEPDTGAGSAARDAARDAGAGSAARDADLDPEDGTRPGVVPADEWRAGRQPQVQEGAVARAPAAASKPTARLGGAAAVGRGRSGRRNGRRERRCSCRSRSARRVIGPGAPGFLADREARGLAGSAADRLASGSRSPTVRASRWRGGPSRRYGPPSLRRGRSSAHLAAGNRRPPRPPSPTRELADLVRSSRRDRDEDTTRYRAPEDRAAERRARAARVAQGDAPAWEEPRRYEAYPTIKSRSGSGGLPRLGIMVAALALAAVVLFALPGIFGWFGSNDNTGGPGAGATATPTAPAESASPSPTVPPEPTPQVYVIRQGDTLSKIANRFGVSLDELLAANEDRIKNPDRIAVGDEIIIPVPSEEDVE
ncbi:MAG: LysM peptidoglycan-binding domain-containing protein [Chloroflexi bacterium]|nr:LysM peptidoglycan-binding domain-containing protein [Chloroflexota bacterium]